MAIEADIFVALDDLVDGHVYGFLAPQTMTVLPRITYQQVGGTPINFLENSSVEKDRCRFQFNGWHRTRHEAVALGRSIANALRAHTSLQATAASGMMYVYEEDTGLYGTRQDFNLFG